MEDKDKDMDELLVELIAQFLIQAAFIDNAFEDSLDEGSRDEGERITAQDIAEFQENISAITLALKSTHPRTSLLIADANSKEILDADMDVSGAMAEIAKIMAM